MRAAARRGQAIVESVLGILVFVSVLLFGIHFAEVTFSQMKVTEASQAAIWDSTAGQMHVLPTIMPLSGDFTPVNARVASARASAEARYMDFDGRTAINAAAPQQILSRAQPGSMSVQCQVGVGGALDQRGAGMLLRLHELLVFEDNGGMTCHAEAGIDPFGTMRIGSFLEDANGFFRARHDTSVTQTAGYRVCSVNRPNGLNGPCRGDQAMLIDDWGLASGGSEARACPILLYGLPCFGNNIQFWSSANLMYNLNATLFGTQSGADYRLASFVGTPPGLVWNNIPLIPGNPTSFYMSFCGENASAPNCLPLFMSLWPWPFVGDGSMWMYQTTPYFYWPSYLIAHVSSSGCYLGKPCNSSSINNP